MPKEVALCKPFSFKSYKSGGKRNLMIFQQKHLWVMKLTNFSAFLLTIMLTIHKTQLFAVLTGTKSVEK